MDISNLNYEIITLVPKTKDAKLIPNFRPICILIVSFKILTKIIMNILEAIVNPIIFPIQIAFIKGRYIMEGVVYEAPNTIHKEKWNAMLFKVHFEKAYDKDKWPFVHRMLSPKGFPDLLSDWIMSIMRRGHVGIKLNDSISPYYTTHKGLRQGDPLSPLLFNLVDDALAMILIG